MPGEPLTRTEAATLVVAAVASAWASSVAWQGPPERARPALPPARERPPTSDELATLHVAWRSLAASLSEAEARRGAPLPAHELEARAPDGRPWLPQGIPDNPLVPGIGWVVEACPATELPAARPDWVWCPSTGELWATGAPGPLP
jgi:hypothetical protein